MSKIFYDTEFLEGKQDKRFLGFKYGETKPTIDLISIGLVSDDNREYYAISKDFNLKEAWNRYDLVWEQSYGDMRNIFPEGRNRKVYWIRENVLKPIWEELSFKYIDDRRFPDDNSLFTIKSIKNLLNIYGKTNKQIAEEVFQFVSEDRFTIEKAKFYNIQYEKVELFGYYSDFDHTVLAWLFGKMVDLPKCFPMYTIDLKQIFDEKQKYWLTLSEKERMSICQNLKLFSSEIDLKMLSNYPKQENLHSAIHDARWNRQFYEFLNKV